MTYIKRFTESSEDLSGIEIPKADEKLKIVINYILENASSDIDLKWKLNKYLQTGDVSFLGNKIIELKSLLKNSTATTAEGPVTEGKTAKATKKPFEREVWDTDRKEAFRDTLKSFIKSNPKSKVKQVGDDFEIHFDGEHVGQVMFRKDLITVKKTGSKFGKEFKYTELGKIKSEIKDITK
jgi:hypothetical protein